MLSNLYSTVVLVVFSEDMTNRINRVKHENFTEKNKSIRFHIFVVVTYIRMYKIHVSQFLDL